MHTAQHVMTKNVVCIPSDTTLEDAARLFLDKRISGAPVVNDNGQLIGIISEFNLLAMIYNPGLKTEPIHEHMTKDVQSVTEETQLSDVANLFIVHRIRRVPVTRAGKVVGIISRRELIRYALEAGHDGDTAELVASIQATVK